MTLKHQDALSIAGGSLLCLTGAAAFMLPATLPSAVARPIAASDSIRLSGTIHDLRASHPDFDVIPSGGYGHYAGNVNTRLGAHETPSFGGAGLNAATGYTPTIDMVAGWDFNEGGGGVVNDTRGLNNGTLEDGPTWEATGKSGGALRFDGTDDYVNIPSSPEMQVTGDVTFAGWFKLDNAFNAGTLKTQVIMEKFLDTEHDFHVGLTGLDYNRAEVPKGTLVFKVENGPTSNYYCYVWTTRQAWAPDTWYHFAAVLESGDTANNKIFINGVDDTASTIAAGVGFLDTDYDAPMRIGGKTIDYSGVASDIFFDGMIDDVMIYHRAVTEADFVYGSMGFEVGMEWRDSLSRPIAPHLYQDGTGSGPLDGFHGAGTSGSVLVTHGGVMNAAPGYSLRLMTNQAGKPNTIRVNKVSSLIDGDVYVGAGGDPAHDVSVSGGATITGTTGTAPDPVPFPAVTAPSLGPSVGDLNVNSTRSIGGDYHFDSLTITNSAILTINTPTRIVCDASFTLANSCQVQLAAGAWLDVYVLGGYDDDLAGMGIFETGNAAEINTGTADPGRVSVYYLGSQDITSSNGSESFIGLYAPNVHLTLDNSSEFTGAFIGKRLSVVSSGCIFTSKGAFGSGRGSRRDSCGAAFNDSSGSPFGASTGGITSGATFEQWYRDVLGTNLSMGHAITLVDNGSGVYEYLDDSFLPIDGNMFGNEGEAHNYLFTYRIKSTFTYSACGGQFLTFQGADDAWVFVDGQLGIDLGGVLPNTEQVLSMDRLDLVDGETYDIDLYYAQRQTTSSVFRMRTNIGLTPSTAYSVSAGFD